MLMRIAKLFCLWVALQCGPGLFGAPQTTAVFPVSIAVDAGKPLGQLQPIWRMFGADEPNYAILPNGREFLGELGALRRNAVFFRAHNLLCSGDGTPALKWGSTGVYSEDEHGKPVYNWTILDAIFDTYLTNGLRPYAQIGFMPEALSIHPQPYQHHWAPGAQYGDIETGWAYPPKDYDKWRELAFQWVRHCVERYGKAEVETWYGKSGMRRMAFTGRRPRKSSSNYTITPWTACAAPCQQRGSAARTARGPAAHGCASSSIIVCMGPITRTGRLGTPLDFVSFHAKGSPSFTNGHVRMGLADQLQAIDWGFSIVQSYPELKISRRHWGIRPGRLRGCQGEQLGYRNTTMYSSYTAASFARAWTLARRDGVNLDAALTWAFTFEGQPPFAGFRQLASAGIDLPVLNVFRLFSRMSGAQLAVSSDHEISLEDIRRRMRGKPDVSALASFDTNHLTVLLWHSTTMT